MTELVLAITVDFLGALKNLTAEEREEIFSAIKEEFCTNCGCKTQ